MLHIHIVWLYLNLNGWYSRWYLFIVTCLKVKHFYFACTYKIHLWNVLEIELCTKAKYELWAFTILFKAFICVFFLFVYFLLLVESEFSDLSSSHDHKESKDHFRPFREGSLQFLFWTSTCHLCFSFCLIILVSNALLSIRFHYANGFRTRPLRDHNHLHRVFIWNALSRVSRHITLPDRLYCLTGCMICLGKSNYFRFNHPREAKRIKESNPGNRFSIVPDQYYPGK